MNIRICDDGRFDEVLSLCKKYNVGIEYQTFHNPFISNYEELIDKQKRSSSEIVGKSLHAPFWDLNIGTKMPGLRAETMDILNKAYNTAKQLGCTEMVVHNGYIPGSYYAENWIKRACDFWREFFVGKDDAITICIENQFELDSSIIKKEIDMLNDCRLKVCLDIGHAHANSLMSVDDWIKTLDNRIGYVHLHNNHGNQLSASVSSDEHLGFDDGTLDMAKVIKLLKEHCSNAVFAIECHVEYIEDFVNKMKNIK